jgi:hypothetical protein
VTTVTGQVLPRCRRTRETANATVPPASSTGPVQGDASSGGATAATPADPTRPCRVRTIPQRPPGDPAAPDLPPGAGAG